MSERSDLWKTGGSFSFVSNNQTSVSHKYVVRCVLKYSKLYLPVLSTVYEHVIENKVVHIKASMTTQLLVPVF